MNRLPFLGEVRWLAAQYLLRGAMRLAEPEMGLDAIQAFRDLLGAFKPDREFETAKVNPKTAAQLFSMMVAAEIPTDDPNKARWAVVQENGVVRLVADQLFRREGDAVYERGTEGFAQAVRYWMVDRARGASTEPDALESLARLFRQLDPFADRRGR